MYQLMTTCCCTGTKWKLYLRCTLKAFSYCIYWSTYCAEPLCQPLESKWKKLAAECLLQRDGRHCTVNSQSKTCRLPGIPWVGVKWEKELKEGLIHGSAAHQGSMHWGAQLRENRRWWFSAEEEYCSDYKAHQASSNCRITGSQQPNINIHN